MEILIKGARIVDFSKDFVGDVYITEGYISEIGKELIKDCKTINAEGYTLLPSFIDMHSHFREPGFTHKEDICSGSKAAARGGYTGVNLMANTKPVCSDMGTVNYVINRGKDINLVDIHQTVSITKDLQGDDISHLENIEYPVKYISDDGKGVSNNKIMFDAMMKAKEKGLKIISHTENEEFTEISTRLAENMMTGRDIALAKFTGCDLHLAHVSTKEAMEYIIQGKKDGVSLSCEVTPHHIALTSDTSYRVNPSLRETEDVDYIIKAIKDGWVDVIATDHAPHTAEDKIAGAPGMSGLETAFSVCYTKLVKESNISLNKLSELMSKRPGELMGWNKGKIEIGYQGDLVLVDTESEYTIDSKEFASKGKNTPFNGIKVFGEILITIKGGQIVYKNIKLGGLIVNNY
jgi:dihydroorotase